MQIRVLKREVNHCYLLDKGDEVGFVSRNGGYLYLQVSLSLDICDFLIYVFADNVFLLQVLETPLTG